MSSNFVYPSATPSATSLPQLCYTDANTLAPNFIHPCWTSHKTDHYSCCMAGDKCLYDNACYNPTYGITYQYGCTDSEYKDGNCPSKCNLDRSKSNWAGLVYCNGKGSTPNNTWVCNEPDNCLDCPSAPWNPQLEKLSAMQCSDLKNTGKYVAFTASASVSDLMPLPTSADIPDYYSRNADRWNTTVAATTTAKPASVTDAISSFDPLSTSGNPTVGTTATDSPSPSTSNPNRTTMAVGLGLGIPAFIILVVLLALLWNRKRKRNEEKAKRARCITPGNEELQKEFKATYGDSRGNYTAFGHGNGNGAFNENGTFVGDGSSVFGAEGRGNGVLRPNYGVAHQHAELPGEGTLRPMAEVHGNSSRMFEMEGTTLEQQSPGRSQTSSGPQTPFVSPLISQRSGEGLSRRVSGIDTPYIR